MEYYIYLTIVHHPKLGDLYYAGKKKSEGPEKDKKYHGSCDYQHWKKWLREHPEWFETEILQWFETSKEQGEAETDLIIQCLLEHGAFLYGTYTKNKVYRIWLDPFGKGTCLNGHWQGNEQMNNPEVYLKSLQTRIENGSLAKWIYAGINSRTAESYIKSTQTRAENGSLQKWIDSMNTSEAQSKSLQTRIENGSQQKFIDSGHTPEAAQKALQTKISTGVFQRVMKLLHSSEIVAKVQKTRKENGAQQRALDAMHSHESRVKAMQTMKENGTWDKLQNAARAARNRKFKWLYDGVVVYVGNSIWASRKSKPLNQVWIRGDQID